MEHFFRTLRGKSAPIGVAVDPLTGHECGNQRYLAIPWFDVCLAGRLAATKTQPLQSLPADQAWLAPLLGTDASPATDYNGEETQAVWLPNESIAKKWMQYVRDTAVTDTTPPPTAESVTITGRELSWDARADLESGISHFIIERDGNEIARVPSRAKNPFGRPVFQGLQYSDTPAQPLVRMNFTVTTAESSRDHVYNVISVNTVGLRSR
jgi:hypothetical protein